MELRPAEAFHERVILLQHRARLVAVRIVMVMFLVWVRHVAAGSVKGMYPAPHIHEHFYDTQMATANCVHPHAQLEHA